MEINQLIHKSQKGDQNAFGKLVLMMGDYVFSVVFRLVNNELEAEDIAQNVFVKAWQNINKYNEAKGKFSTWLYTIATRIALDHLKTNHAQINLPNTIESDDDIEKDLDLKLLGELLNTATGHLSPQQKLVFVLRDLEEMDVDEVVQITGYSEKKIKDNLYVARKKVKEVLSKILKVG
ncbi:RNA polymerase sigma factor [Carboxylicivirga linearis]|uniref:RNA polymerase sigma factor n=1 Tax=Carboxylicivirga linearis TaxID=1628157 RepID=A0ABS5JTK1_9BACT|nr:sigma-70 family RNA polymerase sigma factor [Carboxylicivirga linearis]MBS2098135.1 sigma-70 family RNA polymerase sigma factor [Carboxylicivirga linearis]